MTDEESARIFDVLAGNIGLSDYEREVNNADFLLTSGKFKRARAEYDRIILTIPAGERILRGRLLHNRGVALARLLMFDLAAESFREAFALNAEPESGRAYLTAIRLKMEEVDYIQFISEHPAFHDLSLEVEHIYNQAVSVYNETDIKIAIDELILDKARGNGNSYYSGIDRMIEEMKQEYRNI